jgi:DNA gyrase subunit B
LRYHKIIIATDADVDGAHIRTLLLTLFYRYFKGVIEGGFLYIAQPPLYKISLGKEIHYAYSDSERDAVYKKLGVAPSFADITEESDEAAEEEVEETEEEEKKLKQPKAKKLRTQRYKGLGEMNPEELWETTMDPERRVLKQVKIVDAQDADRVFDILMGTDVPARKSFIQSNAKSATIDV